MEGSKQFRVPRRIKPPGTLIDHLQDAEMCYFGLSILNGNGWQRPLENTKMTIYRMPTCAIWTLSIPNENSGHRPLENINMWRTTEGINLCQAMHRYCLISVVPGPMTEWFTSRPCVPGNAAACRANEGPDFDLFSTFKEGGDLVWLLGTDSSEVIDLLTEVMTVFFCRGVVFHTPLPCIVVAKPPRLCSSQQQDVPGVRGRGGDYACASGHLLPAAPLGLQLLSPPPVGLMPHTPSHGVLLKQRAALITCLVYGLVLSRDEFFCLLGIGGKYVALFLYCVRRVLSFQGEHTIGGIPFHAL